jgi:hypothetical protein
MSTNYRSAVVVSIALLGTILFAGNVASNTLRQIQILCATHWPKQPERMRVCVERHTAAADDLLRRIEAATQTSIEFAIGRSCIERAKIRPPSTIDWIQALTCFESRYATVAPSDDP